MGGYDPKTHRTKRERVTDALYAILQRYGEPMSANDLAGALWDDHGQRGRGNRSKRHDTVSPVTIGMWLRTDPNVHITEVRGVKRYRWVGQSA